MIANPQWNKVNFSASTNIPSPKNINFDFWDWDSSQTSSLNITHTYKPWNYFPKISLSDEKWKVYSSNANIFISSNYSDNCLLIKNPDQLDQNNNWIWDECEKNSWNFQIWVNISGSVASFASNNSNTSRNFWDWKNWNGQNISHTYNPWNYYVVAKDGNWNTSSLYVSIGWKNTWYAISTNGSSLQNWKNINISNQTNSKNSITYNYDSNSLNKNPNENFLTTIKNYWCQKIDSFTSLKSSSSFTICTNNTWTAYISSLNASNLTPKIWEKVDFNFVIDWSSSAKITQIQRNIAWTSFSNKNFQASKIFDKYGQNFVSATAILEDWTKLYSSLTLDVWENNQTKSYFLQSSLSWKNVSYNIVWIDKPVKNIYWSYWDWLTSITSSGFSNHQFNTNWNFLTKAYINFSDSSQVSVSSNINIIWLDRCEDQNFTKNLKCDMNWNGIGDVCDSDIDWDGVSNPIGLIMSENSSCKYDSTNVNIPILTTIIESQKQQSQKWNNTSDNCAFISNKWQLDLNLNWIWDVCETQIQDILDKSDTYKNTKSIIDIIFPKLWDELISQFNKPCWLSSCGDFGSWIGSEWVKATLSNEWQNQVWTDIKIIN